MTDRIGRVHLGEEISNEKGRLSTYYKAVEEIDARRVPEIRHDMQGSLVQMLRVQADAGLNDLDSDQPWLGNHDYSPKSLSWMFDYLADAQLWWVGPEMCDLLQSSWPTMPPTTYTPELLPAENGLVVFAKPLYGLDALEDGRRISFNAMMWGPAYYNVSGNTRYDADPPSLAATTPFEGKGISICMWKKWQSWTPLGRTDWPEGFDTEGAFVPDGCTPVQLASIIEDRRLMAAFCELSQQTNLTETKELLPARHVARRLARYGVKAASIRLVDIHAKHRPHPNQEHRVVEWTRRWIVGGHWRQQAYGPGRSLRRPTWVAPYIKGPEDKPLITTETVKVWKR